MSGNCEMLDFINPATGEKFGEVRMATPAEVQAARREMAAAAPIWAAKSVKERVRILRKFQAVMIDAIDEVTAVITQDNGKSRQDAAAEVIMTVDKLHQYYKHAPEWLARRKVPRGLYIFRSYYTEPRPYGTVAVIGPWNYPFDLIVPIACSALLAGNTVLVKPSEVTGATGVMIEKLFQRVPELAPFVRFLHGDSRVGAALVDSRPDLIFLTGSARTGKIVGQKAAETMTPFLCELGGKDPMIVLEDADVAAAARWGVWGAFYNTGQSCVAVERAYVVEEVYDAFVTAAIEAAQKYKIGYTDAVDNPYHMGPLSFERQRAIIEDHLNDALARGARIMVGGRINGMFMEPTIVVDVDHTMKLMWDETFGPILPIMKVKDQTHAIQLANHSYMGLGASIWTRDLKRGQRIADQLEVGTVNINDALSHYPVSLLPFGGVKQSGNARTHGRDEVMQFTQPRSVAVGNPPFALDVATILRSPGHYELGKAIMYVAFGETPEQRIRPVKQFLTENEVGAKAGKAAAAVGMTAAVAALAIGLFRGRK